MNQKREHIAFVVEGRHIIGEASCVYRNAFTCYHTEHIILES